MKFALQRGEGSEHLTNLEVTAVVALVDPDAAVGVGVGVGERAQPPPIGKHTVESKDTRDKNSSIYGYWICMSNAVSE